MGCEVSVHGAGCRRRGGNQKLVYRKMKRTTPSRSCRARSVVCCRSSSRYSFSTIASVVSLRQRCSACARLLSRCGQTTAPRFTTTQRKDHAQTAQMRGHPSRRAKDSTTSPLGIAVRVACGRLRIAAATRAGDIDQRGGVISSRKTFYVAGARNPAMDGRIWMPGRRNGHRQIDRTATDARLVQN